MKMKKKDLLKVAQVKVQEALEIMENLDPQSFETCKLLSIKKELQEEELYFLAILKHFDFADEIIRQYMDMDMDMDIESE
jgi:hypothetical protein